MVIPLFKFHVISEAVNILGESVKGQETAKGQRDKSSSSTTRKKGRGICLSDGNLLIWDSGSRAVQCKRLIPSSPNQQHLESWWEMTQRNPRIRISGKKFSSSRRKTGLF